MKTSIQHMKEAADKLDKVRRDFKRGVHPGESFTISIHYGGNKDVDIHRVGIGSVSSPAEGDGKLLMDMVVRNLEGSIKFWKDVARREAGEITAALAAQELREQAAK